MTATATQAEVEEDKWFVKRLYLLLLAGINCCFRVQWICSLLCSYGLHLETVLYS